MKHTAAVLVLALGAALAALPARADKRLDGAITKAEAQLAKGKPEEALRILQKEAARAPRDPEPPLALSGFLTRLGRLEEASQALAKAGELAGSGATPAAVRARVRTSQSVSALRAGTTGEALLARIRSLGYRPVEGESDLFGTMAWKHEKAK